MSKKIFEVEVRVDFKIEIEEEEVLKEYESIEEYISDIQSDIEWSLKREVESSSFIYPGETSDFYVDATMWDKDSLK